ncbi:hypothetical protein [Agromyces sp. NPDC058104]|uniref:hypothetical protein n=1 Tax=Agromyces sp. NPDC058104 TaxID=3346342 RepID=UPI0036DEBD73
MRLGSILSEAWRNYTSGTAKPMLFTALFIAGVGSLLWLETRGILDVYESSAQFHQSGASTLVVELPGGVDPEKCEALSELGGVAASGAARLGEPVAMRALPSAEISVFDVTPGFLAVVEARTFGSGGVFLSDDTLGRYGLAPGDELTTTAGRVPVAGSFAYPDDGRSAKLGTAILAEVPAGGTFDECWIRLSGTYVSAASPVLAGTPIAAALVADTSRVVRQLNSTLGEDLPTVERFDARLSAWAPAAAAAIGTGLILAGGARRRLELATARQLNIQIGSLALMLIIEAACLLIVPVVFLMSALVLLVTTAETPPDMSSFLIARGAAIVAMGAAGCVVGSVAATAFARPQYLYRYFQRR